MQKILTPIIKTTPHPHDPEPETLISLKQVWAGYERKTVLEDVNLKICEQDFVGIIGPNGGGKTTFLKVLLGLISPQKGTIKVLGRSPIQGRKYIGYVPQLIDFDRSFPVSVRDVVRMGRLGKGHLFRRYNKPDESIVQRSLEQVGLANFGDRAIGELSGGEQQRVYIARALASEPRILLLDEPTANVDPRVQKGIYELLKELNQFITLVMVSHDLGAISTYVKTVGCLNRRFHYHNDKVITAEMIEQTYQCPVDLIAHGIPHRVFPEHSEDCSHHHD